MNNDRQLYYGIDLGTTNSAIAYGHIGGDGKLRTQILLVFQSLRGR